MQNTKPAKFHVAKFSGRISFRWFFDLSMNRIARDFNTTHSLKFYDVQPFDASSKSLSRA